MSIMEFVMALELRQWLLILGSIAIVLVLLHGYFLMRARKSRIRMKLDKNFVSKLGEQDNLEDPGRLISELPNGGARVISTSGRRVPPSVKIPVDTGPGEPVLTDRVAAPGAPDEHPSAGRRIDPAGPGEPVLTDRVAAPGAADEAPSAGRGIDPAGPGEPVLTDRVAAPGAADEAPPEGRGIDPAGPGVPVLTDRVAAPGAADEAPPEGRGIDPAGPGESDEPRSAAAAGDPAVTAEPRPEPQPESGAQPAGASEPPEFIIVNVLARDRDFSGRRLWEILFECGLSFGEMDIFHRLDHAGEPQFSLASAVEPGIFDMATIDSFKTPGVTLFMRVYDLADPLGVFEEMLDVANAIAREFNGEIRDETRSVLTPQTIEHCRQSIREYQFRSPV